MKLFGSHPARWIITITIALTFGAQTWAGLLPDSGTVTPDGTNFRYTYGVVLTTDSTLRTGDYFTIYDFNGLVPQSNVQPAGFAFSSANVGPTPAGTNPTDNPNIPNVTWTYTGPTTMVGQVGLGNFMVDSQYPSTTTGVFTSITQRQVDGQPDANITETRVPIPGGPTAPEPSTLAIMGFGLPLIGLARHLQRRRSRS